MVEPYDFTSLEYDLSMTKEELDGNVHEYLNYLNNFKFTRFVSIYTWNIMDKRILRNSISILGRLGVDAKGRRWWEVQQNYQS